MAGNFSSKCPKSSLNLIKLILQIGNRVYNVYKNGFSKKNYIFGDPYDHVRTKTHILSRLYNGRNYLNGFFLFQNSLLKITNLKTYLDLSKWWSPKWYSTNSKTTNILLEIVSFKPFWKKHQMQHLYKKTLLGNSLFCS